jgi:hypothetical protein
VDLGLSLEIADIYFCTATDLTDFWLSYLQNFKEKNPETTDEQIVAKFNEVKHLKGRALSIGLPREIAKRYFTNETLVADTWFKYLQNFKEKNPEVTDEQIAAKFNEIKHLEGELQLRALSIGLSPEYAKNFNATEHATYDLHSQKLSSLENLKKMRHEISEQELNRFYEIISEIKDESIPRLGEILQNLISRNPGKIFKSEVINEEFLKLLKDGLDAPAPDAAGAGASPIADDGRSSTSSR